MHRLACNDNDNDYIDNDNVDNENKADGAIASKSRARKGYPEYLMDLVMMGYIIVRSRRPKIVGTNHKKFKCYYE